MADASKATIDGFTTIASNISLYRPQHALEQTASAKNSPAIIVLCSWMSAAPKHIAKYTAGYQKLFPGVPILLIQSSLKDTFASDKQLRSHFVIAYNAILSCKADRSSTGPVVLHAMSNGGAIASTRMATIFKDRGDGRVFDQFVCDCMPSIPNVEKGVQAVAVGLPRNFILRFLGALIVRIWMHVAMFLHCAVLRQEDILTRMRRLLNDTQLYNPAAPRLYMYSKQDKLVPHEDVHLHAEDARAKGWKNVEEIVFEHAPHCGLVMENDERYWEAVKRLVEIPLLK